MEDSGSNAYTEKGRPNSKIQLQTSKLPSSSFKGTQEDSLQPNNKIHGGKWIATGQPAWIQEKKVNNI